MRIARPASKARPRSVWFPDRNGARTAQGVRRLHGAAAKRPPSDACAPVQAASAYRLSDRYPHLAFAALCISGFLALPLPVACRLSFARLTADQGSPANSQARTATPHLGKRALTLDN